MSEQSEPAGDFIDDSEIDNADVIAVYQEILKDEIEELGLPQEPPEKKP